jgi:hypothetical protein
VDHGRAQSQDNVCDIVGFIFIHGNTIDLKNAPAMFSRIVVITFKDFIGLDDWMVLNLLKENM